MKSSLFARWLGLLAASATFICQGAFAANGNYLCQTMLVELPAAAANSLKESTVDPWQPIAEQIEAGSAALRSAPSFLSKSGFRELAAGKTAKLEMELIVTKPDRYEITVEFQSADFNFKGSAKQPIGQAIVLGLADAPGDSGRRVLLVARVVAF